VPNWIDRADTGRRSAVATHSHTVRISRRPTAQPVLRQAGRRAGLCRAFRWGEVAEGQPAASLNTAGDPNALIRTNANVSSCGRTDQDGATMQPPI
jgi:hypothetical protein